MGEVRNLIKCEVYVSQEHACTTYWEVRNLIKWEVYVSQEHACTTYWEVRNLLGVRSTLVRSMHARPTGR